MSDITKIGTVTFTVTSRNDSLEISKEMNISKEEFKASEEVLLQAIRKNDFSKITAEMVAEQIRNKIMASILEAGHRAAEKESESVRKLIQLIGGDDE